MWEEQLHQAVDLIKKKQYPQAAGIIREVLKQDPNNTSALWLMANAIKDPKQQEKVLKRLLAINPNHANANKLLTANQAKNKPKAIEEKDYDWSKMSATAKDKQERQEQGRSPLIIFAVIIFAIVGFIIFGAVAYVQFAPILNQSPLERELSQLTRGYIHDMLRSRRSDANDRICLAQRLSALEVADLTVQYGGGNVLSGASFNVSDLRVINVEQDGDSASGLLIGTVIIRAEDDGTSIRQPVGIDDILRQNIDIVGGIRSPELRFVYEFDEWYICI